MAYVYEKTEEDECVARGEGLSEQMLALLLPRLALVVHWNHPHTCAAFACRRGRDYGACAHAHGPLRKTDLRQLDGACAGCALVAQHNRQIVEFALKKMDERAAAATPEVASPLKVAYSSSQTVEDENNLSCRTDMSHSEVRREIEHPKDDIIALQQEMNAVYDFAARRMRGLAMRRRARGQADELEVPPLEDVSEEEMEEPVCCPETGMRGIVKDSDDELLKRLASFRVSHTCYKWKLSMIEGDSSYSSCCVATTGGVKGEVCCRGPCSPHIQNYRALTSKIPQTYCNQESTSENEDVQNCPGCYAFQAHEDFMNFYLEDNNEGDHMTKPKMLYEQEEMGNCHQRQNDIHLLVEATQQLVINNMLFYEHEEALWDDAFITAG